MQGKTPRVSYEVNGNAYDKSYYLADGIYPDWATLVKSIRNPNSEKTRRFAKMKEACGKDVERGFGVLRARWAIVRHPARTWSLNTMHEVMACCVIMHNMIVEKERPNGRNENHWEFQGLQPPAGRRTRERKELSGGRNPPEIPPEGEINAIAIVIERDIISIIIIIIHYTAITTCLHTKLG
ncbi:hypothetical protein QYE76_037804 [Lolium multiflorum]|uniref:Protein ALP1-like n=1 Tax=Lolium multiflorum TaxID=4521 RepID=A0AAD8QG64_LOLMU|nr:hypothetical protein QYE76_037804 [Lolium multiflorum]